MQFMSQAVGLADCILLAVAPIGAITTVVSAIRVAGPTWLKSFIGRARENLAAAEVEVMSSTSKETCELWNGHRVVRCPGSANIYQFICLIPKDIDVKQISSTLAQKGFTIRYKTLKAVAEEMENADKASLPTQEPQTAEPSALLQKKGKNYLLANFLLLSSAEIYGRSNRTQIHRAVLQRQDLIALETHPLSYIGCRKIAKSLGYIAY